MALLDQVLRDFEALVARSLEIQGLRTPGQDVRVRVAALRDEALSRLQLLEALSLSFEQTRKRTRIATSLRNAIEACIDQQGIARVAAAIREEVIPFLTDQGSLEAAPLFGEPDRLTDHRFGNWRLGNRFSNGGYGTLYWCVNEMTGVSACAKALDRSDLSELRDAQTKRFRREIRVPLEVGHPALVPILDPFDAEEHRTLLIVMEFLQEARHHDEWCKEKPIDVALRIIPQLIAPLALCHEKNLVHRDIKPANVLVQRDGRVRLLDFGLVAVIGDERATRSNQRLGTLEYNSPEQLRESRGVGPPTDVWALGAILLELIQGKPIFRRATQAETLDAITRCDYILPEGLSDPLAAVIRKCLSRDPMHRFANAAALGQEIENGHNLDAQGGGLPNGGIRMHGNIRNL